MVKLLAAAILRGRRLATLVSSEIDCARAVGLGAQGHASAFAAVLRAITGDETDLRMMAGEFDGEV
jgi:hypothetical protein